MSIEKQNKVKESNNKGKIRKNESFFISLLLFLIIFLNMHFLNYRYSGLSLTLFSLLLIKLCQRLTSSKLVHIILVRFSSLQ